MYRSHAVPAIHIERAVQAYGIPSKAKSNRKNSDAQ